MAKDKDIINDAREHLKRCQDRDAENRLSYVEDIRFAKLAEQWPEEIVNQRNQERRPCLTVNKLPQFLRQVVNDARQNRPSINVKPVDSAADRRVANVFNGLIRNIEITSKADIAYDTGLDCAVSGGFGYFRIDLDYAYEDSFDLDINVNRISNPLTVYGDPASNEGDSSDWNVAFVTEMVPEDDFKARYPKANLSGFETDDRDWKMEGEVRVAEYWVRDKVPRTILRLSNGTIVSEEVFRKNEALFIPAGLTITGTREITGHKVTQYLMTSSEVLKTVEWPGCYIPIVPVYGDEVNIEGKRYLISLVRHARDPQRMFNYWRTASTELVALAPRVPFIGPRGFAKSDPNWETANIESHPYLEYDGNVPPQRQPLDSGVAAGAIQEALNASDDLKSVMGIYDASLGARSNETSGRAIIARQREGDVSTYHFIDNLTRAIRHAGCIMVDLIPKIYTGERIVRVTGEDGKSETIKLNAPTPQPDGTIMVYDLSVGKYDVTVKAGPSFTTRREEAAAQMIEFVRNYPNAAPIMGDVIARNMDWPEADKIEQRLNMLLPPHITGRAPPPEVQQMQQQMQQMGQQLQQMGAQLQKLQGDLVEKDMTIAEKDLQLQAKDLEIRKREVANVQDNVQRMVSDAQRDNTESAQRNAVVTDLQSQLSTVQQAIVELSDALVAAQQPRFKSGKAIKLADGEWALTAVEDSTPPTVQ